MTAVPVVTRGPVGRLRPYRRLLKTVARYAAVLAFIVVFLFPVYWVFMIAFKTPEEIFSRPPVWIPAHFRFDTFVALFTEGDVNSILPA